MQKLSAEAVASLQKAIDYYDCAGLPELQVVNTFSTGVVILSEAEAAALKQYCREMEEAVFNHAFAPSQPSVVEKL